MYKAWERIHLSNYKLYPTDSRHNDLPTFPIAQTNKSFNLSWHCSRSHVHSFLTIPSLTPSFSFTIQTSCIEPIAITAAPCPQAASLVYVGIYRRLSLDFLYRYIYIYISKKIATIFFYFFYFCILLVGHTIGIFSPPAL